MIGQQISHYRLEKKLGEGTYGAVYRGVHLHDDELVVAIKVVHPNLANDQAFVSGLRKECRLLAKLVHPNIVAFRDLVLSEDHPPAMVLELLEGQDLYTLIKSGPRPLTEVLHVLKSMMQGLAAAHQEGVVHRDIKPSNVMVCTNGNVKVLDFGIARAADAGQATKTGVIQGTLDYVAPEVFSGEKATAAADVYAMGLVVWEMLTGKVACADGSLGAKLGWHLGVGPTNVRTLRQDCPAWLAEFIMNMVSKNVDTRPRNGAAVLALLEKAIVSSSEEISQAPAPAQRVAPSTVTIEQQEVDRSLQQASGTASTPRQTGAPPEASPAQRQAPNTVAITQHVTDAVNRPHNSGTQPVQDPPATPASAGKDRGSDSKTQSGKGPILLILCGLGGAIYWVSQPQEAGTASPKSSENRASFITQCKKNHGMTRDHEKTEETKSVVANEAFDSANEAFDPSLTTYTIRHCTHPATEYTDSDGYYEIAVISDSLFEYGLSVDGGMMSLVTLDVPCPVVEITTESFDARMGEAYTNTSQYLIGQGNIVWNGDLWDFDNDPTNGFDPQASASQVLYVVEPRTEFETAKCVTPKTGMEIMKK